MKPLVRVGLTILALFMFMGAGTWLLISLFAAKQLYNSYNLWQFFYDAPMAALILAGMLGGSILLFIFLIKKK